MNWLKKRLSEPSTYAGLALLTQFGKSCTPHYAEVFNAVTGLLGALAVAVSEKSNPTK